MSPHTPAIIAKVAVGFGVGARLVDRQLEHRAEKPDCRVADRELRRVHAHGDAACAGVDVVAGERALARSSSVRDAVSASGCAGITWPARRCSRTLCAEPRPPRLAQNLPSRALEVRRLAEQRPAALDPFGDALEQLVDADRRRRERRLQPRSFAEQRVGSLRAGEARRAAETLAEPRGELANGQRLAARSRSRRTAARWRAAGIRAPCGSRRPARSRSRSPSPPRPARRARHA